MRLQAPLPSSFHFGWNRVKSPRTVLMSTGCGSFSRYPMVMTTLRHFLRVCLLPQNRKNVKHIQGKLQEDFWRRTVKKPEPSDCFAISGCSICSRTVASLGDDFETQEATRLSCALCCTSRTPVGNSLHASIPTGHCHGKNVITFSQSASLISRQDGARASCDHSRGPIE
jgi:hypothetical protein